MRKKEFNKNKSEIRKKADQKIEQEREIIQQTKNKYEGRRRSNVILDENEKIGAFPVLNFAISTYYKGTGLEEILKKLEEYLDNADVNESDITNI